METLGALRGLDEKEIMEKALDLNDSSVADALHLMTCMRDESNPDTPRFCDGVGDLFRMRYKAGYRAVDLDKEIASYEQSVKLTPEVEPERVSRLVKLGLALSARSEGRGILDDVERAIIMFQQAIDIADDDDPKRSSYHNHLGTAFDLRFKRLGDVCDIERYIAAQRKAVELAPEGHVDLPNLLNNLGNALTSRFRRLGNMSDLEMCIGAKRKAVELTPEGDPERPGRLSNLGIGLALQFGRLGNVCDLEASIDAMERAVDLTPDGHPHKEKWLNNLGTALRSRFENIGDVSDLEASVNTQRKAVELTPDGHPRKPNQLYSLGVALRLRFQRLESVADLDASIDAQQKAGELTPEGHPGKCKQLTALGIALCLRFQRLGNLPDLEAAIDAMKTAVGLTPEGHPNKSGRLSSLGVALRSRFHRLGNLSDLEASVDAQWKAVALTPDGHPEKPGWMNNLAAVFGSRFRCLQNISDLDASINTLQRAVELTPEGHPNKAGLLDNLGCAYILKFESLGNAFDLEASIDAHRKAVELTPEGHPETPSRLSNLGIALQLLFKRLGNVSDLEASIEAQQKAVDLTPEQHVDKPRYLKALGNAFFQKMERFGDDPGLRAALEALSASAQSVLGVPSVKLDAAQLWGTLCHLNDDEQQTMRGYACAMSLIPQAAWMGLAIEDRHKTLVQIGDLVTKAAGAAVRYGNPDLALEWLEQGRSIVWGQTLQLRSPVDIVRDRDPVRAERLIEISRALEANSKDKVSSTEERSRQLRSSSLEWDEVLAEVRQLNGFEDFLGPKKVEQLLPAADLGPIVVLNIHQAGCNALVLMAQADEVLHIPLQLTSKRAQVLLDSLQTARAGRSTARHPDSIDRHIQVKGGTMRDPEERIKTLLAELWNLVVKPVLDGLAFSLPDSMEADLPRICWCPTGPLAFLPIHAAGIYDTEDRGTKVSEFVVSSYTPSVAALLHSSVDNPIGTPKILAVAQSQNPGRHVSALPETKQEITLIRSRAAANLIDVVVAEDAAGTVDNILEEMTKCNWIHLACHGIQDAQNPTKSAFILADGNLELEEIVKLNLPHAEFAFLSTCQTATGDAKLAEEAVHLAAGLLLAGYKSILATMWSIEDRDGPFVADAVYSELLKDGRADASRAAHALHKAVQQLRASGSSFLSWMPFVHMGR